MGKTKRRTPYYRSEKRSDVSESKFRQYGTSRNPIKCHHCREFLTEQGREAGRCTECKHTVKETE